MASQDDQQPPFQPARKRSAFRPIGQAPEPGSAKAPVRADRRDRRNEQEPAAPRFQKRPPQSFDGPPQGERSRDRGPARGRSDQRPPRQERTEQRPTRRDQFSGQSPQHAPSGGRPPRRFGQDDRRPGEGERRQFGGHRGRGPAPEFHHRDESRGQERYAVGQFQRLHPQDLQVGQGLRVKLESFTPDGECVAHLEQFVLFVTGGIPGEFVDVVITTTGSDFARARVERPDLRTRSRTMPKCRHFGVCGGCMWQHIDYPYQLKFKTHLLREMLEFRLGKVELPILAMIPSPHPFGHRNKVFYQFECMDSETGLGLVFGHNRLHAPDLEWVRECPVHNDIGESVARSVYRILKEHKVPAATEYGIHDGLKSLLVRASNETRSAHVVFVATGDQLPLWQSVVEKTMRLPGVDGVHLNLQPDPANTYLGRETRHLAGQERLREKIGGVEFQISPDAFFQTNAGSAEKLFEVVLRSVADKACDPILDLYAGGGLLSLPLAQRGRNVLAIEENPRAVADGLATIAANGIRSCEFIQGKVEAVMRKMPRDKKFHTVLLDPPREGCPEWILRLIGRGVRPKRMVYVSCNPQALARDLVLLLHSGYRLEEIQPVDMFPHTAHIESVAVLTRK